ncbi:MAG: hypothetical protein OXI03_00515, partial [Chloroflexota bacterium]|nr:hypothetical protein [Chloroflexota bacterium]
PQPQMEEAATSDPPAAADAETSPAEAPRAQEDASSEAPAEDPAEDPAEAPVEPPTAMPPPGPAAQSELIAPPEPEPEAETLAVLELVPAEEEEPLVPDVAAPEEEEDAAQIAEPEPADQADGRLRIRAHGTGRPIAGAHVASVAGMVRSDADGVVALDDSPAADGALEQYHVVAAGFWPRRAAVAVDGVITLRPLEVRAVYLPYERLWDAESLDWALGLARAGLISAIVIDIKEEGGGVLPLAATAAVRSIDAVVDPGADMAAFLDELAWLGVYRIARQVVFLDTRLGRSDLETALLTPDGRQLRDDMGLGWTTPFSAKARRYNIDIALQAARHFDEIQFDYIRFPAGPFQVHAETTGEQRSAAVARFAREAGHALHAVGAAVSIDTFGETTVIRAEDAVGQVLEDLIPYVDYYSPMLYPSTWAPGTFGLEYPPAHPGRIVEIAMRTAVERVRESGVEGVLVRPWLQDYRDYQPRRLHYGYQDVMAQIEASAAQGGAGFMLWNPALRYETDVLATLRDAEAVTVSAGGP